MAVVTPDIVEIANLLKRERYYRDTGQWCLCRAAFHPDPSRTHINVAWYAGQVEGFIQQSAEIHQGKVNIIHSSFDPVDIRVKGCRATSEAFCLITSSISLHGVDYELSSYIRLVTRLEKCPGEADKNPDTGLSSGQWRMLSLEAIYVRDSLIRAFPDLGRGAPAPCSLAELAEVENYPRSYRNMALVMLKRGLSPRPDLPNEDDQESVRRVLRQNQEFLDGTK
ncbi:hypothetical protein CNMCM8980_000047 [Aspergillus fumigatiaffinis]|uniref:SnoaL-like domain-containing protein n=1 Tax=Aspergillus fumigatiaffinis TaxID=340414 RepID=A0A8H4H1Z3_9EURO|nr:hypothetical protein CNMCM5878_008885 [Aspergillus fumigatiaffinis]KAF4223123.1 hypothetical protein CNMCM6457_000751 [Aspergillus fumigatiaffinis]KAF4233225.1 hypothetical protein CNMCM6805_009441 [Aspergillus fumigatiaffinis]KAF4243381.1 hypothetical protein CNMCM8980_000047 [Aspergillus fumigatiaffinis]